MIFRKRSLALFSVCWVDWSRLGKTADVAAPPLSKQLSILAQRNGRVSRLSGRIDTSNVLASKRNTRGPTSSRDHEHNTVDPQPRPRQSRLHNMARDRSKVRSPGTPCNSLHSRLPRTGPKAKELTKSIVSIGLLFHSQLPFRDKQCSSSYNHIRFRQNFTRLRLGAAQI